MLSTPVPGHTPSRRYALWTPRSSDDQPEIHDLNDFFRLSAILNMQLSAKSVGKPNIISVIYGQREISPQDSQLLQSVLEYLGTAYGESRRKLGSLALLHPLRAASLLAKASDEPSTLDLLTELLHDKLEDLTRDELGQQRWKESEDQFQSLLKTIDPLDEWYLMERLEWLTRQPDDTYFGYIGRLLDHAEQTPSLVAVKLADRLDNTLDMRIDLRDPIEGVDFFATMFQVGFVNSYSGYVPVGPHPQPSPLNGAQRLYQLFKNAVLLSLIRQRGLDQSTEGILTLFNGLTLASMKEAQRTVLHIFGYHLTEVSKQRDLLMTAMTYAQSGGMDRVTRPREGQPLDGLFMSCFDDSDREIRDHRLDALYEDKELMVLASLAFIVIFLSFLDEPTFSIVDMPEAGILPRE
jgi:hypothetical protein